MDKHWINFCTLSFVHFMAYPECIDGYGPIVETVTKIAEDLFFNGIELGWIKDPNVRSETKAVLDHSQCLEAWFMHVPGIKIAMPSNAYDAKGLLKTAIRDPNMTIIFENKMLYNMKGEVPEEPYFVPFGECRIVSEGDDITVVALSDMVVYAIQAAEKLANDGILVEVIDPRTIAPLDIEPIVQSVKKTGRLVVAHEANITGGVGAEIVSQVVYKAFDYLKAPVERVGAKDSPIPFSPVLEQEILPDDQDIVAVVTRAMEYIS